MSGKQDGGREAVSWLATGAVCFLGILFCGVILLTFVKEPSKPILVMSGVLLAFAVMLYLLREKPKDSIQQQEEKWFGLFRKPKVITRYKLTRHRKPKIVQFGTNEPPTVERIRELREVSDGMKNWSPPETDPHHEEHGSEKH